MNLGEATRLAAKVVARVSAFDQTVPADSEVLLDSWARQIARTDFTEGELTEGVLRAYGEGADVPRNKLGAVLAGARASRKDARKAARESIERRLALAPGESVGYVGTPSEKAYCTPLREGALRPLDVVCSAGGCKAAPGEVCVDNGATRRFPHMVRGLLSMNTPA